VACSSGELPQSMSRTSVFSSSSEQHKRYRALSK
jgi:hypothetical protein